VTPGGRRTEEELAELGSELAETEQSVERSTSELLSRHRRSAEAVRLVRAVMREQAQEQVGLAASGAAFWLIISAFPTAIAAVNIFGLVVSPGDVAKDLGSLASAGPSTFGSTVTDQLQQVAAADHVRLSTGLAVSLVLAIWSASGGIYNLERAIRTAYGLRPERYVDARVRAFVGAFVTVFALGVFALISAGISGVLAHVPAVLVAIVGIPVLMVFVASAIAGLYRVSIGRRVRFRAVLPGSLASACGLALVVVGFSTYLRFSSRFAAVYGALAGAVIVMIGTYLAVYVVLLGAVLNVQLAGTIAPELEVDDSQR
jgi:membrane protein